MKKTNIFVALLLASLSLVGCKKDNESETTSPVIEPGSSVVPHTHSFSSEFAYNATHHYHVATCGHEEVSSYEEHNFVNGVCSVCQVKENMLPTEATLDELVDTLAPDDMKSSPFVNYILTFGKMIEGRNVGLRAKYVRYPFTYTSKLPNNQDVLLSGAITFPYSNGKPVFKTITISSHATFTDLSDSPSFGFDPYIIPALAGTIVIECDQLGYGVSKDYTFDYHSKLLTGRNTLDGVLAAGELIKNLYGKNIFELPMFNVGYSQGGYSSLAFLRYLEMNVSEQERSLVKIAKTFSGSGAYDLSVMLKESLKDPNFSKPQYLLMAFITAFEYYPEIFGEITYEDILTPVGLGLVEVLLQKNDKSLNDYIKANVSSSKDVFLPDCFDESSDLFKNICAIGEHENLLDGNWTPEGDVTIYYSEGDELVSPECSKKAIEMWKELENFSYKEIGSFMGSDHFSAALDYYLQILGEIADYAKIE